MKFKCKCGAVHTVSKGVFVCECGYSTKFDNVTKTRTQQKTKNNVNIPPNPTIPTTPQPTILPIGGECCGGSPSLLQKARNLAHTMGDFAGSGFKLADKEVYDQRMEICRGCDRFENNRFCKECGCFMDLKAKIEVAECPLDKWSK